MEQKLELLLEKEPDVRKFKLSIALLVSGLFIWSLSAVESQASSGSSLVIARNILLGILQPDTELLFDFTTSGVAYLLLETICIAFLGTIIGAILSFPLAFLAAKTVTGRWFAFIMNTAIMAIRTIPVFVYGLMLIRVTGPGAFAGVLTMSLTSIGMLTKLYIDAIEELDTNLLESFSAQGCNTFDKIRFGILPQLFSNFTSIIIYRFDMNLRDATVLGLCSAGGIGAPLIFAMNSYRWNEVGSLLTGLIVLVLIIEFFSTKIRTKLVHG